jgi:SAM-dependent methyltransferase
VSVAADPFHGVLHALAAADWSTAPLRHAGVVGILQPRAGTLRLHRGAGGASVEPGALPVATNGVDGLALLLALPVVGDLDGLFAELRRVLRPGGTLVVVVPSVSLRSVADLRWRSVLRPAHRGPWRHRSALDGAGWLLTAADFAVLGDDRVPFTLPLPDGAAASRVVDDLTEAAIWPPDLGFDARRTLTSALVDRAGPGRTLPVPLRRLVARR